MNSKRLASFVFQSKVMWMIILMLVISNTAKADDCPEPPPPPCAMCPPTPPDPPCYSCDPPDQIKFADPCAGGDCYSGASPFTSIYIAGTEGLQKRTSKGSILSFLPVLNASIVSCLVSGNEQNLFAANYESGLISVYDMEENLVSNVDIKQNIAGQISIDKLLNIFAVAESRRELIKYDKNGDYLSTFYFPDLVESIDISHDQCLLLYSNDKGEVKSFDLCNRQLHSSRSQPVKLERVNSLKILPNGDYIVSASTDIQRFNSSGVLILKYDVPSHDNWISLTLDPDGKSFWAADNCNSNVWKFDVESGKAVSTFNAGTIPGSIRCILAKSEPSQMNQTTVTKVSLKLNLSLQYTSMNGEEILVSLRKSKEGFPIVGIGKGALDEFGVCSPINFSNIVTGEKYFIVLNHRSSIETWSSEEVLIEKEEVIYDFTSGIYKALGDNMISADGVSQIIAGDLNQDGIVDGTDMSMVENQQKKHSNRELDETMIKPDIHSSDAEVSGVIDLNGDKILNNVDLLILEEMTSDFSGAVLPQGAELTSKLIGFGNTKSKNRIFKRSCDDRIIIDSD